MINVKDYGAVGDNVVDDTLALESAIEAASLSKSTLYIPEGRYKITSELVVAQGITIYGAGPSASILCLHTPSQNGFIVNTTQSVCFYDFWIGAGVPKTAGSAILLDLGGTGANSRSRVENVTISGQWNGIRFNDAIGFTVTNSYIVNSVNAGIIVDNNHLPDGGDSYIAGNTFDSSNVESKYAIYQSASGGLKIIGNKILRHHFGYILNLDNGVETSILIISSNSFEHQKYASIKLTKQSGFTGKFLHTIISNNQINGNDPSFWGSLVTPLGIQQAGTGWFAWLNVSGNIIQIGANGGIGVELDGVSTGMVQGNVFVGTSGTQRVGISVGVNSYNISVRDNVYSNLVNNIVNASSSTLF